MNQEETLALWEQGKEAWNAWAEKMLTERKALKDRGEWDVTVEPWGEEKPANKITEQWFSDARTVFSSKETPLFFPEATSFEGWLFPSDSRWIAATFDGDVVFNYVTFEGVTDFNDTTFEGVAWFNDATFSNDAGFNDTTFSGGARFIYATFDGDAHFSGATFEGIADFSYATFDEGAWFSGVNFNGDARFIVGIFKGTAWFSGATFEGIADFSDATFEGDVGFDNVFFNKPTRFSRSQFNTNASFNSAQIKQAFDLSGARFKEVPNFRQTHCEEAPLLDDVLIESTIIKQRKSSHDPDFIVTANYRALKRLAIQGHDHKHEVEFFAEELRAQRIMVHKFLSWDWWLSALFAITSDYGRSILRPIAWWLPVMLISALSYLLSATLAKAPKSWGDAIYQSIVSWYHGIQLVIPTLFHISWLPEKTEFQQASCKGGSVVAAAYNLAVSKGLIIPGIADRTLIIQAYDCLYDGDVPFAISWIMGIQTLLSAALLFLLLLGIRNRFKLK